MIDLLQKGMTREEVEKHYEESRLKRLPIDREILRLRTEKPDGYEQKIEELHIQYRSFYESNS